VISVADISDTIGADVAQPVRRRAEHARSAATFFMA